MSKRSISLCEALEIAASEVRYLPVQVSFTGYWGTAPTTVAAMPVETWERLLALAQENRDGT